MLYMTNLGIVIAVLRKVEDEWGVDRLLKRLLLRRRYFRDDLHIIIYGF